MLWLRNSIFSVIACLQLTGCGFEPVYADRSTNQIEASDLLASTMVKAPTDLQGEQLKAAVEDLLNPQARSIASHYRLELGMTMDSQPFIFNSDGTAGRYEVTLTIPYNLYRLTDNKRMATGSTRRAVSYNVSESDDYATFVSKNDAIKRVIREAAEDVKMRLGAYFMRQL